MTEKVECRLRRLSDVLREEGAEAVDVLKVDVEGAEMEVLQGIDDEHWAALRCAVVEVHDVGGRLAAIQALLLKHGLSEQHASQESLLAGTNVHFLVARRPPNAAA